MLAPLFVSLLFNPLFQVDHAVPEAQLYREGVGKGEKLPDAVIRGPDGSVERVVEFGGSYGKQKLIAFHNVMSTKPYELW